VVAVTICAAFALAQDGATTNTIVVTAQQYPWLVFTSPQYQWRSAIPESSTSGHVIGTAEKGYSPRALTTRPGLPPIYSGADFPNHVGDSSLGPFQSATHSGVGSVVSYLAGTGQAGFSGDGGEATAAELNLNTSSLMERSGIAVAADGTIYIADTNNGTIRAVASKNSSEPGIIRSIAGKWGPRSNVTLAEPMGIAVDRAGDIYVADHSAGIVAVYSKATEQLRVLAHVVSPASIAVTADGTKVFVASPETGGVFVIPTNTRAINVLPEFTPVAATADSSDAGPCADLIANPQVADTAAEPESAAKSSAAAKPCPAGLTVDGRGNLFVSDANGGQILRIDAITGKSSIAVTGMITPGDIAFDPQRDLFVAEQGRNRILAMGQVGDPASNLTLTAPAAPFPAPCPQVTNPYTFCNEPQGGVTQSASFLLANTSATQLSGITITPPVATVPPTQQPSPTNFTVLSTTCTATLAPNSTCTLNVAFTPLGTGAITGSVTVTDTAGDTATVNLAGTGDDYKLSLANGQTNELTVVQGQTATFKAQVTADGVFGADGEKVTFVCPKTMPAFSTCAFQPCPVSVSPNSSTAFSIFIATSTATKQTPPITNPCEAASSSSHVMRAPRFALVLNPGANPPKDWGGGGRLPALGLLATALISGLWLLDTRRTRSRSSRAPWIFALAACAVLVIVGCHKGSSAATTATPVGVTSLTITANALDANGNPINASRALQFTIDVVKGPQ
jgi:sugar lactone lactonase YvrE